MKADLTELKKVCQSVTGPFVLDLPNLLWADSDGVRTLIKHGRGGIKHRRLVWLYGGLRLGWRRIARRLQRCEEGATGSAKFCL